MAPPRYGGAISNGFQFSLNMGALSSNLNNYGTVKLGNDLGWRISLSMASIPAAVLARGAIFLPETPNSLIQRTQNHHKAKLILQRIRGTNDVQAELDDLVKASDVAETNLHPFHKKTQRKYRPQLAWARAPILSALVIRIVSASSTFISMLVVDKLGQRVLFSVGGVQMLASQVTVGCIMKNQLGDYGWVSKGELFVHHYHRSDLFVDVMPLQSRDFLLLRVVGGGDDRFVYQFLPETKNVPIEQVDRVRKEYWFWKRIVGDVD
ncbi:hypothetical protein RHSIM_Rhsim09G0189000 [Rhododendron simsii]|uniref:Uncharacterized protein n=1 Tax=Rhododendron simsii TaxID=118357 RepID=A0A834GJ39_RHOSS|nr:hypothetical protein RHSIM_Rhsim09G0189000 [Rhododendron simsii]